MSLERTPREQTWVWVFCQAEGEAFFVDAAITTWSWAFFGARWRALGTKGCLFQPCHLCSSLWGVARGLLVPTRPHCRAAVAARCPLEGVSTESCFHRVGQYLSVHMARLCAGCWVLGIPEEEGATACGLVLHSILQIEPCACPQ